MKGLHDNFKGIPLTHRFLIFLDSICLFFLLWGFFAIPQTIWTVIGGIAWAVVFVCMGFVLWNYCIFRGWIHGKTDTVISPKSKNNRRKSKPKKNLMRTCYVVCATLLISLSASAGTLTIPPAPILSYVPSEKSDKCMFIIDDAIDTKSWGVSRQTLENWLAELEFGGETNCACEFDENAYNMATEAKEVLSKKGVLTEESDIRRYFAAEVIHTYYDNCQLYTTDYSCKTPAQYVSDNLKTCRTCKAVGLILTAIDAMTFEFDRYLRENNRMIIVIALCFAFWLLWITSCFFLGLVPGVDFVKKVFIKIIWLVFVCLCVFNPLKTVFGLFLQPLADITIGLIDIVSDASTTGQIMAPFDPMAKGFSEIKYCKENNDVWETAEYAKAFPGWDLGTNQNNVVMPAKLKNALVCPVSRNFKVVATALAFGQALTCYSIQRPDASWIRKAADATISALFGGIKWPTFSMWIPGLILSASSYVMMNLLPFFMVDAFFFMSLFFVPFPLWCLAMMYKPSRPYAKRAFMLFIHSLFCLVTLAIASAFILEMFTSVIAPTPEITAKLNAALTDPEGKIQTLSEVFSASGSAWMLLMMAFVVVVTYKLLLVSVTVADQVLGVSVGGVSGAAKDEAMSSVKTATDTVKEQVKVVPRK